jgi:ethanolamine ammonia-lyase large subunit
VIDEGVNETIYAEIKSMQLGELREWLLADTTTSAMIRRISNGLTAEMIAGVAKLMSNLDLMIAAKKIRVTAHCNTTIGLPGTLSSRNQPNHPTASPAGITASIYEGLSFGSGDCVIGINPSDDSLSSVSRLFEMTHQVITTWEIPTQNSVLAHITTQMEALKRGVPIDLLFQSLAGSEKANQGFGISVGLLDEAYQMARKYCNSNGPNYFYFETGQGTALSAGAHEGADRAAGAGWRCHGSWWIDS